jgi:hypothetical protein
MAKVKKKLKQWMCNCMTPEPLQIVIASDKMTRQRRWQNKRLSEGKCVCCGAKRNLYSQRCDACQTQETERARNRNRCNPWKAGGRGRKPKAEAIAA